ncbi:MFS transporter superfamily protein [Pleurotus pulmonarius]
MNVPSAIAMIRTTCPDPVERSAAYAAYALAGTVGNVSGFVIGGVLTARTSWRWIHFLIAIMVIPAAGAAWFLLPTHMMPAKSQRRGIDIPGVVLLTSGLILFVYAISDGAEAGWGSPQVVTTLVLSVIVVASFFVTEKFTKNPALPSKTWTNKNFTPLFFYAWSPYWWCLSSQLQLVNVFMNLWHDSPLIAAVRCIPIGVAGGIASFLAGRYAPRLNPKHMLVCSQALMALGSVLFALAGGEKAEARYWSYIFPGMVIGMFGLAGAYVGCTTMVMGGAREGEEGVVGAVMYTAYQVGATLGFAIVTSITEGVNTGRQADSASLFAGYAASFWSMVAMPVVMLFIALLFVRP